MALPFEAPLTCTHYFIINNEVVLNPKAHFISLRSWETSVLTPLMDYNDNNNVNNGIDC